MTNSEPVATKGAEKRCQKRSKDGCLTCRFYRKGCDKEKPTCRRCRLLHHECTWPPPMPPLKRPRKRQASSIATPLQEIEQPRPMTPGGESEDWVPETGLLMSPPDISDIDLITFDAPLPEQNEQASSLGLLMDEFAAAPSFQHSMILPNDDLGFDWRILGSPLPSSIWTSVDLSYNRRGNPSTLKAYSRSLKTWIGGNSRILAAFDAHVQRIWDADDDSSVAIRSSAEAAGAAFGRSFAEAGSPEVEESEETQHRDIRHHAGEIVDKITAKPDVPFWVKVTALLELATYEFFTHGALNYLKMIGRAEELVFGIHPRGSQINLSSIRGIKHYGLANYVWADVCRSIACLLPTSFHYVNEKSADMSDEDGDIQGLEYMNGCPDEITVILAMISELGYKLDFRCPHRGQDLPAQYKERAEAILSKIDNFCISLRALGTEDGVKNAARAAIQEIWRQSAYIHLYLSVYQRSPLFHGLKKALSQMLKLYSMVEIGLPDLMRGPLPLPLFLTASIAISEEDRRICHKRLVEVAGNAGALKDCIGMVERCWKETDETGVFTSWRVIAKRGEGQLAFL